MPRPPLQSLEVDGFTGCFTESGGGPELAFVISPFARIDVYWPTVAALSKQFRVTAIEPPGSGCGSVLNPAWGFERYADWLAAFLRARRLPNLTLVGHSNSAAICALCAAAHPGLMDKLVLVDPVGAVGPTSYVDFLLGAAACAAFELRFALRLVPRFFGNLRRHPHTILKQLQSSAGADLRSVARRIGTPTLVAWGGMDFVMPASGARKLGRLLPQGTSFIHPHGNHDWLIEHPEEFAGVVRAYVQNERDLRSQI